MTKRTVDQVLDKAADILEKDGFTTSECYNPQTGGYCALGAIAKAAFPKASPAQLDNWAMSHASAKLNEKPTLYSSAVGVAAASIEGRKRADHRYVLNVDEAVSRDGGVIYAYNDRRSATSREVVAMLRRAAQKFRDGKVVLTEVSK